MACCSRLLDFVHGYVQATVARLPAAVPAPGLEPEADIALRVNDRLLYMIDNRQVMSPVKLL